MYSPIHLLMANTAQRSLGQNRINKIRNVTYNWKRQRLAQYTYNNDSTMYILFEFAYTLYIALGSLVQVHSYISVPRNQDRKHNPYLIVFYFFSLSLSLFQRIRVHCKGKVGRRNEVKREQKFEFPNFGRHVCGFFAPVFA